MPMQVVAIRRYPVKSMGGEGLDAVAVDARGLVGDRMLAVQDDDGRLATGKDSRRFRRRDAIFDYAAAIDATGAVAVTGARGSWRAGDRTLDDELTRAMGDAVRIVSETTSPHQDQGSVSIVGTATLQWCADRFGIDADARRLRVNLVVETDEPFVEETWMGSTIAVGTARLQIAQRVTRCRTIDVSQDGTLADGRWLKPLGIVRDRCVAVYADVVQPGVVRAGDAVALP